MKKRPRRSRRRRTRFARAMTSALPRLIGPPPVERARARPMPPAMTANASSAANGSARSARVALGRGELVEALEEPGVRGEEAETAQHLGRLRQVEERPAQDAQRDRHDRVPATGLLLGAPERGDERGDPHRRQDSRNDQGADTDRVAPFRAEQSRRGEHDHHGRHDAQHEACRAPCPPRSTTAGWARPRGAGACPAGAR